mmetsp:Transcript_12412/g.23752  ORF Transcript_12412/g.23752 Transcript_12412/m.23752 type:complete len:245 (-) Transcript_12412:162-896(-)|eukprot:scaffold1112_cov92-Amphora_coffeaeformis.AAC.10
MLALRTLLKPNIVSTVVRPLVIRGFATPIIRPNVPPPPHIPITTTPHYEVKESQFDYEVDMDIPREFKPEEVEVDIDPDTKRIHVTGMHKEGAKALHFEKDFDSGHALDVGHLQAELGDGHLHLQAKKTLTKAPEYVAKKAYTRPILAETPAMASPGFVTAAPGYDIKEGLFSFAVDMHVPAGFPAEQIKVEFQPDAKGIRITGAHGYTFFDKTFTCGKALDTQNFKTVYDQGYLHFEAPKVHT